MQHGVVAGAAGELVQSSRLTSLADDPDLKAGPVPASVPVSYPAVSAASRDLGVCQGSAASRGQAASLDSAACLDSAAAADSGGPGSVESPAAAVLAAAGADVAADLDARQVVWAAVVAADEAASADASSNRGAHTKGDPDNSVPNNRRD
jgi:hypothetical protein